MDKVILTKAQVESIEGKIKNHPRERVIRDFVTATKVNGSLDGITLDMLNRALYIGYEVEQTIEEKLLQQYEMHISSDDRKYRGIAIGIRMAAEIVGIKVPGMYA